ncbi:hypothetical protein GGR50DRAFT_676368 [Xylaria sp. CBS 124048]|nr:hypothetical protein GGR50DRAFT_676368 [Xylaria sp. CBS 124048]
MKLGMSLSHLHHLRLIYVASSSCLLIAVRSTPVYGKRRQIWYLHWISEKCWRKGGDVVGMLLVRLPSTCPTVAIDSCLTRTEWEK